ncbi:MAG: AAA family ATPase [Candidatus Sericytochromatia bacterium]|nr:AAA family ATPase [Candidatus Tanganyikabacteria bacterium]
MSAILDTVTSYVPRLAIRRKLADPTPLSGPEIEHFPSAVLLADVSGFTALTEALAQRGPEGAEEMTRALNSYFGHLIDIIYAHGGDIVKFAGDAMLVLWPVLDVVEELPAKTLRATQCALALQRQVGRVETIPGAPLSLHAAVGAGQMAMAQLGGVFGRWEYVIMGPALAGMGSAAHQSKTGEVAITPEAWALIHDRAAGDPLDHGCVRVRDVTRPVDPRPLPPLGEAADAESVLKGFLPGAVRFRLEAGHASWLAELRPITVLFVNLPDLGHETPLDRAQALMHALQTATYRFEGSINKLSVDEKGISLVAALGLPPLSHYDDPARGIGAALAIKEKLDAMGIRCSIGVASGRAFCGEVGNAARREYTIMGDVVNLAARLMQAAKGGICCDVATQLASAASFEYEALPAIPLKGKTGLFALFRPRTKLRKRLPSEVRLVGRTAERIAIAERLQAVRERRECQVLLVEGEAGIGKSSLLAYAAAQAAALKYRALTGVGDAIEQQTPYLAWRPILYEVFGIDDTDEAQDRRDKVMRRLEARPDDVPLAPLLNAALPLEFPDTDVTQHLEGPVRSRLTNDLICRLFKDLATHAPIAFVLDDVHWMDSASWALAKSVSHNVGPALLAMGSRPLEDKPPAELIALLDASCTRIQPRSMAFEDARTLVCQKLEIDELPDEAAKLIHDRTGGHPLFIEEVAFALKESGALVIEGGRAHAAPGKDFKALDLPGTVQGVITSRIDRLPPGEQLTLKVASVIGRVFDPRLLADIHPLEEARHKLREHLDTFQSADLTHREIVKDEEREAFKSAVTRDVAYSLLLYAQRKRVHTAVAEWYETQHAQDLAAFFPVLAHHWALADVPDKAAHFLEMAGHQAERSFAYKEAANLLLQALEFDERLGEGSDPARRLRIRQFVGKVYKGMGRQEEAQAALQEALAGARQLGDGRAEAQVLTSLGHLHSIRNEREQALDILGQASAKCLEAGDGQERLRCLSYLMRLYYRMGNSELAIRTGEEAIAMVKDWPEKLDVSVNMAYLGMLYVTAAVPGMEPAERMWKGVGYLQEAVAAKRRLCDKLNLSDTLMQLGNAQWVLGAFRDARESFEEVLAVATGMGLKYDETCARINLAIQCHELGDFHGMERMAEHAQQDSRRLGYGDYGCIASAIRSLSQTYLGKTADGLETHAEMEKELAAFPDDMRPGLEVTIMPYVAERLLLCGRLPEGLAAARRAWDLMEQTGVREYEQRLMTLLGEACYRLGQLDEARDWYARALALGLEVESPATIARARAGHGMLAQAAGDLAAARAALAEAFKAAEPIGSRYLTGEIAARLALLDAAGGEAEEAAHAADEALRYGLDAACPHLQALAQYAQSLVAPDPERRRKLLGWAQKLLDEQIAGLRPADAEAYGALPERRLVREAATGAPSAT